MRRSAAAMVWWLMLSKKKGPEAAPRWAGRRPAARVPLYAFALAALVAVAILTLLLARPASGVQSCQDKLLPQSKYSCYVYYANLTDNASLCGSLGSLGGQYGDQCVYDVATNHSAIGQCGAIRSGYLETLCVSQISLSERNMTGCGQLAEPGRSACIYAIAENESFTDLAACNAIANTTESLECGSTYYYDSAMAAGDPADCAYLQDQPNATALSAVMTAAGSDQSYFALYSYSNVTPRGYCYSKVAYLTGNRSACGSLSGPDAALCASSFANYGSMNATALESYCASAGSSGIQAACIDGITVYDAVSKGNATACMGLNQSGVQYACIVDIATKYNDSSYCSYLNGSAEQSSCVLNVGNSTG